MSRAATAIWALGSVLLFALAALAAFLGDDQAMLLALALAVIVGSLGIIHGLTCALREPPPGGVSELADFYRDHGDDRGEP